MSRAPASLVRDCRGASAAEFALVLPFLLIMLLGIIDIGRYAYAFNRAEKATQVGARFAVVTDPVAPGLKAYDFTNAGIAPGDSIPASALSPITCSKAAGCTCTGTCPTGTGAVTGAWTTLRDRMTATDPDIQEKDIRVTYSGSGLGFAGDPTGMNISPLVTVSLSGMTFKPVTGLLLKSINLGSAQTTLTAEDSVGSQSN